MSTPLSSEQIEKALRRVLRKEGFRLSKARAHGETGVDIIADRGGDAIHIEVIPYKKHGPARTKDFCEGIMRSLSRLDTGAKKCVLAMPEQFEGGMDQRAAHYRTAWKRITLAFPEFSLWLVDCTGGRYRECKLTDWVS
jgi:hypothetical protein